MPANPIIQPNFFRSLADQAIKNAKNLLLEYEKYPEKHPMYPSEWKRYWNRRSKELESGKRTQSHMHNGRDRRGEKEGGVEERERERESL